MKVVEKKIVKDSLDCYVFNATSIRDKLPQFNSHFSGQDFDVISVTETWLTESVFDNEVLTTGQYKIFRRDRSLDTVADKKDGGGVMLAVLSSLSAKRRRDLEDKLEIVWVEIQLSQHRKAFIGTVYINYPNINTLQALECSLDKVSTTAKPNDVIMCFGDFNSRDILWKVNDGDKYASVTNISSLCTVSDRLLEVMDSHNLHQFNCNATCNDNVLDLAFGNNVTMDISIALKACSSTHDALSVVIDVESDHHTQHITRTNYNFKRANWDMLLTLLSLISWSNLDTFSTVNDALVYFYDIVHAAMRDCIPTVRINSKKFPYWYDKDLITLVKEKEKYRNIFVKNGRNTSSEAFSHMCDLRKDIKYKQRHRLVEYAREIGSEMKTNSKRFWTYVKSLKLTKSIPSVMSYNDIDYSSIYDIVHQFNVFFKSVFKCNAIDVPPCSIFDAPLFTISPATPAEMLETLRALNPHSSSGFSNIPAIILNKCAEQLSYPLCAIFNLSISRGEYPNLLKCNNVIPIFKDGVKKNVESYRGISIQPIVGKVFESLINKRLRPHLKRLLIDEQHGFQPQKSTFSNLACYTDYISTALNEKCEVHSIYTDFSKAFDVVPHNLLLLKMSSKFGIGGVTLRWFESYLTDRFQRVVINGVESDWVRVTSGVPQGSILGPGLFLIYINDLPVAIKNSKSSLFADDSKLFRRISSIIDCILLQNDLNTLFEWCTTWKIYLNIKKCYFIAFTNKRKNKVNFIYYLGDSQLSSVSVIKDLGVYLSSDLNFHFHIDFITKKANRMLGFIRRVTKPFNDYTVLCTLYKSLVRSGLEYCSSIWSPSQNYLILKVERVQKRVVKWLCFKKKILYDSSQYPSLCREFGLQPLESRRKVSDLRNFNKILCNKINCIELVSNITFNVPSRQLRRNRLFSNSHRINVRKNSFIPRVQTLSDQYDFIDVFENNAFYFKRNVEQIFYDI